MVKVFRPEVGPNPLGAAIAGLGQTDWSTNTGLDRRPMTDRQFSRALFG